MASLPPLEVPGPTQDLTAVARLAAVSASSLNGVRQASGSRMRVPDAEQRRCGRSARLEAVCLLGPAGGPAVSQRPSSGTRTRTRARARAGGHHSC
jgi:hypothetical protein